jgi:Fe-S-cluster-containing hydrogenase component 2
MGISVSLEKCIGCRLCVKACAQNAIEIIDKKAVIDAARCNLCAACVEACRKYSAITIVKEQSARGCIVSEYRNVAVFIEQRGAAVAGVSYEMLGEGRKLADRLGEKLLAVMLGSGMRQQAEELIRYGADTVYYMDGSDLARFSDERYATVVADFITQNRPAIFLAGASAIGRSFVPKVAARRLYKTRNRQRQTASARNATRVRRQPDGDHHMSVSPAPDGHGPPQGDETRRTRRTPHRRRGGEGIRTGLRT